MIHQKTILAMLLAGAISLAEAVNINCYTTQQCAGGPYGSCTNIGPDICCNALSGAPGSQYGAVSGEFLGLPGGSSFSGWQQTPASPCGQQVQSHSGATNACITLPSQDGQYAGFAWFSGSAKIRRATEEQCKGKQEIDTITFTNGTVVSLEGLSQVAKVDLWGSAVSEWKAEKNVYQDTLSA